MRVAQVGAYKRKSEADNGRITRAVMWMVQNGKSMDRKVEHDIINLRYGRDFLAENEQYGMVIVHSVFDFKCVRVQAELAKGLAPAQVSPLHTEDAWKRRLIGTGAKFIFIFQDLPVSMSGWSLGKLPGYAIAYRDTLFTVYEQRQAYKVVK